MRNLRAETALTQEQADYLDHKGSYEPKPRLRDMDIQGIDQVMIIPTDIDTYPWLQNALGARAMCKAYNEWAYEYTWKIRNGSSSRRLSRCRTPSSRARSCIGWRIRAAVSP